MGDSVSVQCTLSSGDLPVVFSWLFNQQSIQDISGITIGSFGRKSSLFSIDSLSGIHGGNVTCLATNRAGISSYSTELVVKGMTPVFLPFYSFTKNPTFFLLR